MVAFKHEILLWEISKVFHQVEVRVLWDPPDGFLLMAKSVGLKF